MTINGNSYNRILIINPFGIGDVLFTTPVLRAIKENFPNAFIGYVCNRRAKEILEDNPNINILYVYERDEYREECAKSKLRCLKKFIAFLKSIKKEKFDLVIDLSLGRPYNFFSWLIGIKRRVGFNYKNRGVFLTDKIDINGYQDKHVVEHYLDLLEALKINYKNPRLEIFLNEDVKKWAENFLKENNIDKDGILVGLTPGGGASWGKDSFYLHWSEEGFAKAADKLIENYKIKLIILGDAKDRDACDKVYSLMRHKPVMACGKTNLRQFCTLVSKCKLLICNDTGPLHIAIAAGIKTVCVVGPVDERVYGPYSNDINQYRIVIAQVSCRPCYHKFKMPHCDNTICLKEINPDDVYKAAMELL